MAEQAVQYLTTEDLAQRLQVSPGTIREWTRDGIIPAIRINAKVVRYDEAVVDRALKGRTESAR